MPPKENKNKEKKESKKDGGGMRHVVLETVKHLTHTKENKNRVEQTLGIGLPDGNVVDLSVTGLNTNDLQTIWDNLKKFENLTSLGVTITQISSISLQDCRGDKLKKKLERLRMEAYQFSIGSTSAQPQPRLDNHGFESLIDLTLTSHETIDIKIESGLPKLERLRLNGVRNGTFCRIEIQGSKNLRKLVIGEMQMVANVQIGGAVMNTVLTLKLHNLPQLKEVVYSDEPKSLLRWESSNAELCDKNIRLVKTILLKEIKSFPSDQIPGLKIYHYNMNK